MKGRKLAEDLRENRITVQVTENEKIKLKIKVIIIIKKNLNENTSISSCGIIMILDTTTEIIAASIIFIFLSIIFTSNNIIPF